MSERYLPIMYHVVESAFIIPLKDMKSIVVQYDSSEAKGFITIPPELLAM